MTQTLRFLLVLEGIGLAGLPLAARALGRLPGAGAGLGHVLGLLGLGWTVWLAGSLGVPNGAALLFGAAAALAAAAVAARRRGSAPGLRADPFRRRLLVASEALFAVAFLGGALYASYSPDVWGTEKPMDLALMNAAMVSDGFPPHDPWMSGERLNYYYLGHLMLGLVVRLAGVEPSQGYNLALAAVFALTATAAFSLAATVAEAARRQGLPVRAPLGAGAVAVVLLVLMGNLRGGWAATTATGPLDEFDWFSASRVVRDTINEFPSFSLVVGDLHAHVIALPLTLLALAFVTQAALHGPPELRAAAGRWETLAAALSIGVLYAVNSWSWPVMAGLLAFGVLAWAVGADARRALRALAWVGAVLALGTALLLPFVLAFEPNAGGAGIVPRSAREPFGRFVSHALVLYGALLWLLLAPFAARLLGARHPVRVGVWGAALAVVVLSLAAPARLAGAAVVSGLALAALRAALSRSAPTAERLLWVLAAAGLACIAAPELVYVRDEFEGTEHVRMNTVFKLGYQAWVLLALAGAVVLTASRRWLPPAARAAWSALALALVGVGLAYTVVGTIARKDGFADGPRLDGRAWLARSAPGDVAAIDFLRSRAPGDAVVLEAVGDDYSAFGNARISVYTGRPTVLGWPGHELQWSHDPGSRREDVRTLYTTPDARRARELLDRYDVAYAVVGPLEGTFYGTPGVLPSLGRRVYERAGTTVYAFGPAPGGRERPGPAAGG